jgi:hypothetical protein
MAAIYATEEAPATISRPPVFLFPRLVQRSGAP